MPGLPAGLSGLFHLCEGSCLCATSPNGKTNRVLYCYGEVLFNCLILLSTITSTAMKGSVSFFHLIFYYHFYCSRDVAWNHLHLSIHPLLSLLLLRYMFKFISHIKFQCLESFSTLGKLTSIKAR